MSEPVKKREDSVRRGHVSMRHGVVLLVILCAGAMLSVAAFWAMRGAEEAKLEEEFQREAEERVSAVSREMEAQLLVLEALGCLYDGSESVERSEFLAFTAPLLRQHPEIQALEWIPRVAADERAGHEAAARRDGLSHYQITERDAQGGMVRAGSRDEYFPICFVEPCQGNERAQGFDLASDATRHEALAQSRDTGRILATSRVTLAQEMGSRSGLLVFRPVYAKKVALATVDDRRRNLEGFVVSALRVSDLMEHALGFLNPGGVDIWLFEGSDSAEENLLHRHLSRTSEASTAPGQTNITAAKEGLHLETPLDVAGRTWSFLAGPAPGFVKGRVTWQPWGVLAAGLLLTGLSVAYLWRVLTHAARHERLTGQMLVANRRLAGEVRQRRLTEEALRRSGQQYRAVFEVSTDALLLFDPEGTIVEVNPAACAMHGWTREEMIGLPGERIIDPSSHHLFADFKRRVSASEPFHCEAMNLRRDGTAFDIEVSGAPFDYQGRPHLLAVIRDISQRKRTDASRQQALQRQEKLNRLQQGLLGAGSLRAKLGQITEGVVEIFGADFCRVWITQQGDRCDSGCVHARVTEGPHVCRFRDRCLHLVASSGRYTHTDGEVHRRVPFGCYKIGLVASGEDSKFLTNDVTHDPRVHNHQWAAELGLASFAGYQLRPPGGQTMGVLALFSQQPISADEDALLEALGTTTAQVIAAVRAEEQVAETLHELEQFNRLAVGRELRMVELKREVNEMARVAGVAPPYDLAFAEQADAGGR